MVLISDFFSSFVKEMHDFERTKIAIENSLKMNSSHCHSHHNVKSSKSSIRPNFPGSSTFSLNFIDRNDFLQIRHFHPVLKSNSKNTDVFIISFISFVSKPFWWCENARWYLWNEPPYSVLTTHLCISFSMPKPNVPFSPEATNKIKFRYNLDLEITVYCVNFEMLSLSW